jgi:hypothetical protein
MRKPRLGLVLFAIALAIAAGLVARTRGVFHRPDERVTTVWRGKPVFVHHKSPKEIRAAAADRSP